MVLKLDNVSYRYSDAKEDEFVFKNINYEFDKGKIYAIKGRSGSGKTTLLSLISGLEKCSLGNIYYKDKNLNSYDLDHYRNTNVGIIFQSYNLIPYYNALENVILSMDINGKIKDNKESIAKELLLKMGLKESELTRRILKLSGGEQQRVAIARAIAKNPKLLLCDEPTGALDSKTGIKILELLQKSCKEMGMTTVIITHNAIISEIADKVIRLKNGTIEEIKINKKPKSVKELDW